MKRAYATILSTEGFYKGVLVMYESLRRFSAEEVVVFISENISENTKEKLCSKGMTVLRVESPIFSEALISEKQRKDRWNKTLFKLVVFREYGYDKLVYLDSDLLIRSNIDELFDKAPWSAVSDKEFYPEYGREGMNAGVMVIEPSNQLYCELVEMVSVVAENQEIFGDQDAINAYLHKNNIAYESVLGRSFNTCFYSIKKADNPCIVHFIFESKPWMWSSISKIFKKIKWYIKGNGKRVAILKEYEGILKRL